MPFVHRRYDDDLDEVEEEDHFEDVDDLEVSSAGKMRFAVCTVSDRAAAPRTWHCVLGQDTLLSQCFSTPRYPGGVEVILVTLIMPEEPGSNTEAWPVYSGLVRSALDQAVRVRTLAEDTVLCSWARCLTLSVPLSTLVYKWTVVNLTRG